MEWKTAQNIIAPIVEYETWRHYRRSYAGNCDVEDYRQTALLTAWEYCRDKASTEEIDLAVLRKQLYRALYALSAKSTGIGMNRNYYSRWCQRPQDACFAVKRVVSLDVPRSGEDETPVLESLKDERVEAEFELAEFFAGLSEPERKVLSEVLDGGFRSERLLSQRMRVSRHYVRRALASLRRRCVDYFGNCIA